MLTAKDGALRERAAGTPAAAREARGCHAHLHLSFSRWAPRAAQLDVLVPGAAVVVRNSRIGVFGGFLRVSVDKWGTLRAAPDGIASTPDAPPRVRLDNNLSLEEYLLA